MNKNYDLSVIGVTVKGVASKCCTCNHSFWGDVAVVLKFEESGIPSQHHLHCVLPSRLDEDGSTQPIEVERWVLHDIINRKVMKYKNQMMSLQEEIEWARRHFELNLKYATTRKIIRSKIRSG